MCEQCARYADQRDAALKQAQSAIAEMHDWRSKYASLLDSEEMYFWDAQFLLGENAELRSRAERAERRLSRIKERA